MADLSASLPPQNITVLSVGAWGAPLAMLLAGKGHRVTGWDLPAFIEPLLQDRAHPKLPGIRLPENICLTASLDEALGKPLPDAVVITTSCPFLRSVMEQCKAVSAKTGDAPRWVLCTKGIEESSLLTTSAVVESVRGEDWRSRVAVLSGPSLAPEVALGKPTTVCVASHVPELSEYFQSLFMTDRFRVYTQDDVMGVELGGSLKNVIAIAAGACDGLELGENARAALITRGLAEMVRLGVALGARPETLAGLAGLGDLIVTCASKISRNHRCGALLAQGRTREEALKEIGMAVEGVPTARSANTLAKKLGVPMPITEEVYKVLYEGKDPRVAVSSLMQRGARHERD